MLPRLNSDDTGDLFYDDFRPLGGTTQVRLGCECLTLLLAILKIQDEMSYSPHDFKKK